jgi:ectoine hydroxylase-related dioxygenase (phytanoyl-CoA dioxygenase family)
LFKENGYAIFQEVYNRTVIDKWNDIVKILKSRSEKWIFGNLIEVAPAPSMYAIANPTILGFAEQVMGPFIQLDGFTIVGFPPISEQDEQKKVLHWHRDPWGHVPFSDSYERPMAINALCYLQDLDNDIGPLRVIPGSHRMEALLHPSDRKIPHPEERLLFLKAGDVVVLHHNLVHSRTYNASTTDRFYFSVLYNHSWLKQTANLNTPTPKRILQIAIENNDHRIMRLFGMDLKLEARGNSGFLSKDDDIWQEWIREDRNELKGTLDYL